MTRATEPSKSATAQNVPINDTMSSKHAGRKVVCNSKGCIAFFYECNIVDHNYKNYEPLIAA